MAGTDAPLHVVGRGHDGMTTLVRAPPLLTPQRGLHLVLGGEPDHVTDRESAGSDSVPVKYPPPRQSRDRVGAPEPFRVIRERSASQKRDRARKATGRNQRRGTSFGWTHCRLLVLDRVRSQPA
jgi:hypothetical protein